MAFLMNILQKHEFATVELDAWSVRGSRHGNSVSCAWPREGFRRTQTADQPTTGSVNVVPPNQWVKWGLCSWGS